MEFDIVIHQCYSDQFIASFFCILTVKCIIFVNFVPKWHLFGRKRMFAALLYDKISRQNKAQEIGMLPSNYCMLHIQTGGARHGMDRMHQ